MEIAILGLGLRVGMNEGMEKKIETYCNGLYRHLEGSISSFLANQRPAQALLKPHTLLTTLQDMVKPY